MKIRLSCLRGCIVLIGGVTYRVISASERNGALKGTFRILYYGKMECFHPEDQLVWIVKEGRELCLILSHVWLQHGHKGVIHARAVVERYGRGSGSNRWLRVGLDFPSIPSAELAERVRVPWRRRKPKKLVPIVPACVGPVEPFEVEELLVGGTEVSS